jgi:hypothetical protein
MKIHSVLSTLNTPINQAAEDSRDLEVELNLILAVGLDLMLVGHAA